MYKYERIKKLKNDFQKDIEKLDRLIKSCNREKDFIYCIDVIRMYFYTRDKIMDLQKKIEKIKSKKFNGCEYVSMFVRHVPYNKLFLS